MTSHIVILSTCATGQEAASIARLLVERRLAACVNVIPNIRSFYRWKGEIETSDEWLLIVKTSADLFGAVSQALEAAHSYEVPEVIAIPIVAGSGNYLNFLSTSTLPEAGPES